MTRRPNEEEEAMAVLTIQSLPCRQCGTLFRFRSGGSPSAKHDPETFVEALCPACFDAWCWAHPPQDAPDADSHREAQADE